MASLQMRRPGWVFRHGGGAFIAAWKAERADQHVPDDMISLPPQLNRSRATVDDLEAVCDAWLAARPDGDAQAAAMQAASTAGRAFGQAMHQVPPEELSALLRTFKAGMDSGTAGLLAEHGVLLRITMDRGVAALRRRLAGHIGLDLAPEPIGPHEQGPSAEQYGEAIIANMARLVALGEARPELAAEVLGWMHWLDDKVSVVETMLAERQS